MKGGKTACQYLSLFLPIKDRGEYLGTTGTTLRKGVSVRRIADSRMWLNYRSSCINDPGHHLTYFN
jgi:hypothetical protein